MATTRSLFCAVLVLSLLRDVASTPTRRTAPINCISVAQWAALNVSVDGRLAGGIPLAEPCYSVYNGEQVVPDPTICAEVQTGYKDIEFIASSYAGFQNVGQAQSSMMRVLKTCRSTGGLVKPRARAVH
jgi:hypothetical protein